MKLIELPLTNDLIDLANWILGTSWRKTETHVQISQITALAKKKGYEASDRRLQEYFENEKKRIFVSSDRRYSSFIMRCKYLLYKKNKSARTYSFSLNNFNDLKKEEDGPSLFEIFKHSILLQLISLTNINQNLSDSLKKNILLVNKDEISETIRNVYETSFDRRVYVNSDRLDSIPSSSLFLFDIPREYQEECWRVLCKLQYYYVYDFNIYMTLDQDIHRNIRDSTKSQYNSICSLKNSY